MIRVSVNVGFPSLLCVWFIVIYSQLWVFYFIFLTSIKYKSMWTCISGQCICKDPNIIHISITRGYFPVWKILLEIFPMFLIPWERGRPKWYLLLPERFLLPVCQPFWVKITNMVILPCVTNMVTNLHGHLNPRH